MKKNTYYLFILFFTHFNLALAQNDTWLETNTGIADYSVGESFEVARIATLENGRTLAFIEGNTGPNGNGVYELNEASWSWIKIAPISPNAGGFNKVIIDQNRIFDIRRGAVNELNLSTGQWNVTLESIPGIPNGQIFSTESIVNGKLYLRTRVRESAGRELIAKFPEQNFQENETFITVVDLDNNFTVEYMRNPNNPLIIPTRGGNSNMSLVLADGRAFLNQTWDYRTNDGFGGLYEWNGTDWLSASAGLNAINITGSGFGPIGPIYTDVSKTRMFIRTEQGFYEKVEGGWVKFFYRTSANFYLTPDYIFISSRNGNVLQVDRAVKTNHSANFPGCLSFMRAFMTPNNGGYFLGAPQSTFNEAGECVSNNNGAVENRLGIYRYTPSPNKPGTVQNLHLENGTYLGGEGGNFGAEAAYTNNDKLVLTGIYHSNMGVTPTNLLSATNDSKGKVYIMNEWGTAVEQVINLGDAIYDMDMDETTGEIALLGDFGVAVLNADFSLKWHRAESVNSSQEGSYRPRVSIAADGKVIAVVRDSETNIIRLYAADGVTIHSNDRLQNEAKKVYDIEISSDAAHNQYYVCGFKQIEGNLQSAYLQAYPLTANTDRNWKCWGFERGEVDLGNNGADTRLYRIKAMDGGSVYVAGESAGGGPGGFTTLAYNGKDLTTPIAQNGNDFYTDGTNSCGPCHITFLGQVDPSTGTATRGKFFHGRLSSGKTNTHRVKDGDLEIDEDGNVYLVGVAAAQFQDRDVFNVNGKLIQPYAGGDLYVLMTTPNFQTRYLWGAFPKANRGGGQYSRITARRGKVAFFATTTRGEMMTTEGAIQTEPYNIVRVADETDTLRADDVYLATWQRNVWETANNDNIEYPFISADSCFRADDLPCPVVPNPGESILDLINPFNIITPNGDGQNDFWLIENIQIAKGYQVSVFTKTGQVIFQTQNYPDNPWDGINNGQELPDDTYYYVITFSSTSEVKSGYITLIK